MARKEKKYHFIYKTTNLLSGKYYIGMHSTDNLNDEYMGSGKRLRYSINKYGKENHKVEILEFFNTRDELVKREKEIVNLNEIAKQECMNLVVGGYGGGNLVGGFKNFEHMLNCSKAGKEALILKLKSDKNFRLEFSQKISFARKREYQNGKRKNDWQLNWLGRKHLASSKQKMSESSKGSCLGQKNSQYGTCWITKDGKNKKIKQEELNGYLLAGWNKGRYSQLCGENINHSKLSKKDVLEIKRMLVEGVKQKTIANKFMVTQETISKINRGLIWRSVQ